MHQIRFCVVSGRRHRNGLHEFGIVCSWTDEDGRRCTRRIDNITANLAQLSRFVHRLNRLKASPIHLHELVEDFVAR